MTTSAYVAVQYKDGHGLHVEGAQVDFEDDLAASRLIEAGILTLTEPTPVVKADLPPVGVSREPLRVSRESIDPTTLPNLGPEPQEEVKTSAPAAPRRSRAKKGS